MTVRGKVNNGRVVLEKPRAFPEGTEVEVRRAKARKPAVKNAKPAKPRSKPRSLADRLRRFIGKAKGLETRSTSDQALFRPHGRRSRFS